MPVAMRPRPAPQRSVQSDSPQRHSRAHYDRGRPVFPRLGVDCVRVRRRRLRPPGPVSLPAPQAGLRRWRPGPDLSRAWPPAPCRPTALFPLIRAPPAARPPLAARACGPEPSARLSCSRRGPALHPSRPSGSAQAASRPTRRTPGAGGADSDEPELEGAIGRDAPSSSLDPLPPLLHSVPTAPGGTDSEAPLVRPDWFRQAARGAHTAETRARPGCQRTHQAERAAAAAAAAAAASAGPLPNPRLRKVSPTPPRGGPCSHAQREGQGAVGLRVFRAVTSRDLPAVGVC